MANETAVIVKSTPYEQLKPRLLKVAPKEYLPENAYHYDEGLDLYRRYADTGQGEAVITCGGLLRYTIGVGKKGMMGRGYDFTPCFRFLPPVFDGSDLNVAALNTPVSDEYLSSELQSDKDYCNARPEFLKAVRWMGVDCLAAANPHIVDAGTRGIRLTASQILSCGMVPSGIGRRKTPLFEVNGIRIGVLSYTLQCRHIDHYISKTGADIIIGLMKPRFIQENIRDLKERGADFILAYLNTEAVLEEVTGTARTAAAKKLAEAGADYVIGVGKTVVGKFLRYKTADGRVVPLAPAISNLVAAKAPKVNVASMALKITLKKDAAGKITLTDACLPLCHISNKYLNPVVPAVSGLYPSFDKEAFENCIALVRVKTEGRIPLITEDMPEERDEKGRRVLTCAGYRMTFDEEALTEEAMGQTIRAFCDGWLPRTASKIPECPGEEALLAAFLQADEEGAALAGSDGRPRSGEGGAGLNGEEAAGLNDEEGAVLAGSEGMALADEEGMALACEDDAVLTGGEASLTLAGEIAVSTDPEEEALADAVRAFCDAPDSEAFMAQYIKEYYGSPENEEALVSYIRNFRISRENEAALDQFVRSYCASPEHEGHLAAAIKHFCASPVYTACINQVVRDFCDSPEHDEVLAKADEALYASAEYEEIIARSIRRFCLSPGFEAALVRSFMNFCATWGDEGASGRSEGGTDAVSQGTEEGDSLAGVSAPIHRLVVLTTDIPGGDEAAHRRLAAAIAGCDIGLLCCYGHYSRILAEEAARLRRTAFFESDLDKFTDILIRLLRPDDILLVLDGPMAGGFEKLLVPMFGRLPRS